MEDRPTDLDAGGTIVQPAPVPTTAPVAATPSFGTKVMTFIREDWIVILIVLGLIAVLALATH